MSLQGDLLSPTVETAAAYEAFLDRKIQHGSDSGFKPLWMPDCMFPFQAALADWQIRKGRGAIFADCGLGKSLLELIIGENCLRHTNRPVLILTPLAVAPQLVREGEKFGVEVRQTDGALRGPAIYVTNYHKLRRFNAADFDTVLCDESSCIKNFSGKRKTQITEFMRTIRYRGLFTATAAPNDHPELGTSSEALGEMGYMDMLARFFVNDQRTCDTKGRYRGFGAPRMFQGPGWRFKGHAEQAFWRWVCSWARACRKPSDLGFSDEGFILPPLIEREHVIEASTLAPGQLFPRPAQGMREEREERRRTIRERCEKVAELVSASKTPSLICCHLNEEGDLLERIIPRSKQVAGKHSDDEKEARVRWFLDGGENLISKSGIVGFGLNFQHCPHIATFTSHSYEQDYQFVRRCWRFGQRNPVTVDRVYSEGELHVRDNLRRKAIAADRMFTSLVSMMHDAMKIERGTMYQTPVSVPAWL